jgi:hypothetical protein
MTNAKRTRRPGRPRKPARTDRWADIVAQAFAVLRGQGALQEIYSIVERHPRTRTNENWRPKVRQTIQADERYVRLSPGVWALAKQYSRQKVTKLRRLRRERYPVMKHRED